LFAASGQAATFTVNSTDDTVDASLGDGVCATAGGVCTLRAAIQEANALAGADVINVPAGTYSFAIAGQNEDAAATGDLDITADLTINGAGAATTIIDGAALDRIFHILGGTVTINDLTVRNGNGGSNGGGGVSVCDPTLATQPTLHLNDSIVEVNITGGRGGGIAVCEDGHLVLNDSVVRNNIATSDGGGIEQHIPPSTVTITNSTISGNRSNLAGGGVSSFSDLTITNSTISDNFGQGSSGGILHTFGTLTLTNSTVSGNRSEGGGGGLDLAASGGIANLNNVTITNNTADEDADGTEGIGLATAQGGGVHQRGSGTVNFKNTIIAGNVVQGNFDPPAPDCVGTLTSQGYNLIGDTTNCTISGDLTGNITGVAPLLAPLALNAPGTTQTHALCTGVGAPDVSCAGASPAIDAANPGIPGTGGNTCEATDQRGVARPQGPACDIGAYEGVAIAPFAAFAAKVEIELGPLANDDEFEVKATFTLGAGSDGIDPLTEDVSFQVGTFSATIPAGSFHFKPAKPGKHGKPGKPAHFKFEGVINGVLLEAKITPLGNGNFEFKAEGKGAELSGTINPVTLKLTVGDDGGSTTVTAEFE
jgi:CSLREA domain-containing protein